MAISGLFLGLITALVFHARQRRYPLVGWLWFLGAMVPIIGLVQVGAQALADRYAYVSFVGLFCMVVFGVSEAVEHKPEFRKASIGLALLVGVVFGALTFRQTRFWRNPETLWTHTLQVTTANFVAHDSLAEYLEQQGRLPEACSQLEMSVQIFADDMPAQEGLAVCAQVRGDTRGAIERQKNVLRLAAEPNLRAAAFANLGSLYRSVGDYGAAKENFEGALRLNPDLPIALVGIGMLAQKNFDYADAVSQYQHAMRVEPTSIGYILLAKALEQSGRTPEAQQAMEQAQRLSANLAADQKAAAGLLVQ